ncbi:PREDICTED: glutathione synthetase-like isoform X2 [Priapulus caudatus]|nr:PREDICTED: glutathione synthetase-like isoform X2 [Priapulus caudatus]XP_014680708.1 PREDICTED: glutathione synthetase-like isoform X2 [Priapulus caudatus]
MIPHTLPYCTLVDEDLLNEAVEDAKDWNLMHGNVMRTAEAPGSSEVVNYAPFLLYPSPFPRVGLQEAKRVQYAVNKLIHSVATDFTFLEEVLQSVIEVDVFTRKLLEICRTVHKEGTSQEIHFGMLRSDYMFDTNTKQIKQIEVNAIASSFAGLASKVSMFHRWFLERQGWTVEQTDKHLPENTAASGLAKGLIEAWKLYNKQDAVILFVVEPETRNIFDQRDIEYEVYKQQPQVRIIRCTMSKVSKASLDSNSKALLIDGKEVGVVYYRDGYAPDQYTSDEVWQTRLKVERSSAIKCPSIQYHLAGTKKVQQVLSKPGMLERFLDAEESALVRKTFVGLYSLDMGEEGDAAVAMAMENPGKYVLKPQREGGGNNTFGEAIVDVLGPISDTVERTAFILMEQIHPQSHSNYIIRAGNPPHVENVISELGVFGVVIGRGKELLLNEQHGHLLRTKMMGVDEGGVAMGYGAIDSPYLE